MKHNLITAAICGAGIWAMATAPSSAQNCNNPITTRDMVECQAMDHQAADDELNIAYQDARADQDQTGRIVLRDAQRAWIKYRDAECNRHADFARGGTIASTIKLSCLTEMTLQRTRELRYNPLTGKSN